MGAGAEAGAEAGRDPALQDLPRASRAISAYCTLSGEVLHEASAELPELGVAGCALAVAFGGVENGPPAGVAS